VALYLPSLVSKVILQKTGTKARGPVDIPSIELVGVPSNVPVRRIVGQPNRLSTGESDGYPDGGSEGKLEGDPNGVLSGKLVESGGPADGKPLCDPEREAHGIPD